MSAAFEKLLRGGAISTELTYDGKSIVSGKTAFHAQPHLEEFVRHCYAESRVIDWIGFAKEARAQGWSNREVLDTIGAVPTRGTFSDVVRDRALQAVYSWILTCFAKAGNVPAKI